LRGLITDCGAWGSRNLAKGRVVHAGSRPCFCGGSPSTFSFAAKLPPVLSIPSIFCPAVWRPEATMVESRKSGVVPREKQLHAPVSLSRRIGLE